MLGLRVALAVADGLGFGGDVAPGAVVDGVGPDALHVPAAVGSADPLVDELPVVGVGVGVVVAGRPVGVTPMPESQAFFSRTCLKPSRVRSAPSCDAALAR